MRCLFLSVLLAAGCDHAKNQTPGPAGGAAQLGGSTFSSGGVAAGTLGGSGGAGPKPEARYHPPAGFESCVHAEVKADCKDGWCKLPPSCFVMGSPENEWRRGQDTENQTAVTLTHAIEMQQKELTRAEWEELTGTLAPGPENCTDANCPVSMVSWWDAVHTANLLSTQKKLKSCYEPVDCSGDVGKDYLCRGVKDSNKKVYACEGFRLPTRAEAEYAARAGTISTFYSGDITPFEDVTTCNRDPALDLIGWYCANSGGKAHRGGELLSNGFGLYDTVGNLGEWNNDQQHFASSVGGENPAGTVEAGAERLRFSPQYDDKNFIARPASLLSSPWDPPGGMRTGFRLVRTLDPKP